MTGNAVVRLEGWGEIRTDVWEIPSKRFEFEFRIDAQNRSPILITENNVNGWSLLGYPGQYTYAGQVTIISPHGYWLPRSLEEVDAWIERMVTG